MAMATAPLPEDYAALRAFAASLQSEMQREVEARDTKLQAYEQELYAKTLHIEKLKMQLAILRRARFGRSSEKLDSEIEQMELLLGELEEAQAEHTVPPSSPASHPSPSQREKAHPVRRALPE